MFTQNELLLIKEVLTMKVSETYKKNGSLSLKEGKYLRIIEKINLLSIDPTPKE